MARLSTIRTTRLIPVILVFAALGSIQFRGQMGDFVSCCALVFALLGYSMKRFDWPRVPLVIAMALAPMFENNLHLTLRLPGTGPYQFLEPAGCHSSDPVDPD